MRGDRFHRGVWLGVCFSVLIHTGVGIVANTVSMDASATVVRAGQDSDSPDLLTLNFDDAAAAPQPEPAQPAPEELARLVPPPVQPEAIPAPTLDREVKLMLGIDDSSQKTENWLGFADPTEHRAKRSLVEQAQLDPNPGAAVTPPPGLMMQLPFSLTATPAETSPDPGEMTVAASPPPGARVEGRPEGSEQGQGAKAAREGTDGGMGENLVLAPLGNPRPERPPLPGPGPATTPQGNADGQHLDNKPTVPARSPKASRPNKAVAHLGPDSPQKAPSSEARERGAQRAPGSPATATAGIEGQDDPSPPGEHPGDKSEKEADASSLKDFVDIHPGHPAAAQGLEITTKRPVFTRLTMVTAYPSNPLLKVTFNRLGIVTRVQIVESSGAPDVDGPVINAVYEWTAKGKALAELTAHDPTAGVTISVRILFR